MGTRIAWTWRSSVVAGLLLLAPLALAEDAQPIAQPTHIKGDYKSGFGFATEDGRFSLRLSAGIQFRYTYVDFDKKILGNETDYSNFFVRRARLWWDGHAYDRRFTYYFHLQLEPTAGVNLHDAWLQYSFSPLLRLGLGRNKVPYGVEFLASAMKLDFVERSIMYGETDISVGAGRSRWPGGGTAVLALASEDPFTGFPTGGLGLYRSQGISLSGQTPEADKLGYSYELGVWNGRDRRGLSNADAEMLTVGRFAFYPWGAVDLTSQGDITGTRSPRVAMVVSAYADGDDRTRDASGAAVPHYRTRDTGYNLAVIARFRGFSADLEWGAECYEMKRDLPGRWSFDRSGWRAAFGYFVVPSRFEVVARYAELERLEEPTAEAVTRTGVGFVKAWDGNQFVDAIERKLTEVTAGANLYLGSGPNHKVFFDVSLLTREFCDYSGFHPSDQEDRRFRSMVQFKF